MALFFAFLLGIGNFAMQSAVFQSGHEILRKLGKRGRITARRASLLVEFIFLLVAMHAAQAGALGWVWAYVAYSSLNALSVWLVVKGKV